MVVPRVYFIISVASLVAAGAFAASWSAEFSSAFGSAVRAEIQESLVTARLREIEMALEYREYTLLFVGDIMLSRAVGRLIEKAKDPRYPFLYAAPVLQAADLTFGNLEGPISEGGINQGSIYSFRARPETAKGLTFAGFDALSLANNHIMDWGRDALRDTITILKQYSIAAVGAGNTYEEANLPYVVRLGKTRLAFLAYTTLLPRSFEATSTHAGISSFTLEGTAALIRRLKEEGADIVIVSLHWGEEYAPKPSAEQKRIAHALADAGADLIVGHHSHVAQEVERYKRPASAEATARESWIAYSLGNFIFDQNFSEETMRGLALIATVKKGIIASVATSVVSISPEFQAQFEE